MTLKLGNISDLTNLKAQKGTNVRSVSSRQHEIFATAAGAWCCVLAGHCAVKGPRQPSSPVCSTTEWKWRHNSSWVGFTFAHAQVLFGCVHLLLKYIEISEVLFGPTITVWHWNPWDCEHVTRVETCGIVSNQTFPSQKPTWTLPSSRIQITLFWFCNKFFAQMVFGPQKVIPPEKTTMW